MVTREYQQYDLTGLAQLITAGEVSSKDVVDCAIAAIEEGNEALNAVTATCFEQARAQAQSLSANGDETAPLQGVPYLVKDLNTFVAGMPATNGSRAFAQFTPSADSELIRRLRAAGLIIVGKTATPEFGLSICTQSSLFGATRNPFNREFSAGGSSGGSAAAVAAGMVPAALATDSGGSIRIPASHCGLFGLKPTRSRVPLGHDLAEGLAGFSTAHAVTHSVRDSALLLDVTAGAVSGDPYVVPPPSKSFSQALSTTFEAPRVAVTTEGFAGETIASECNAAVEEAASWCAALGCRLEQARPEIDGAALRSALDVLFAANMRVAVDRVREMYGDDASLDALLEPTTIAAAEYAAQLSAADYARAVATTQAAARALGAFFVDYDILLTPVLAGPAEPVGRFNLQLEDWPTYINGLLDAIPFTPLFNATGAPAMSVPVTTSGDGVPIGVHFGAAYGQEAKLLKLAAALEQSHPWHPRR